jgi:V8-like Glu-specific endopeptidase
MEQPFGAYESSGVLTSLIGPTSSPVFQHNAPTSHGQSGAAVRVKRDGGWAAIGIHIGKADEESQNKAVALTPAITSWLLN